MLFIYNKKKKILKFLFKIETILCLDGQNVELSCDNVERIAEAFYLANNHFVWNMYVESGEIKRVVNDYFYAKLDRSFAIRTNTEQELVEYLESEEIYFNGFVDGLAIWDGGAVQNGGVNGLMNGGVGLTTCIGGVVVGLSENNLLRLLMREPANILTEKCGFCRTIGDMIRKIILSSHLDRYFFVGEERLTPLSGAELALFRMELFNNNSIAEFGISTDRRQLCALKFNQICGLVSLSVDGSFFGETEDKVIEEMLSRDLRPHLSTNTPTNRLCFRNQVDEYWVTGMSRNGIIEVLTHLDASDFFDSMATIYFNQQLP